ncbi:MAG: [acyl-carrier-protein] S-malonyltransferase, partial [Bacteroidetes bacterium SW_11_45_7]
MKAHIFPGQGSQFPGMAKDLYNSSSQARNTLEQANEILGFRLTDVMFEGSNEDLKQTKATQPSLFCHSIALIRANQEQFEPRMVAGHSLGEFSALVANGALSFENGLQLVSKRAQAMQKACEAQPSTMAAVMGLDDEEVERICEAMDQIVVPANYNSPGQLVISGTHEGVEAA